MSLSVPVMWFSLIKSVNRTLERRIRCASIGYCGMVPPFRISKSTNKLRILGFGKHYGVSTYILKSGNCYFLKRLFADSSVFVGNKYCNSKMELHKKERRGVFKTLLWMLWNLWDYFQTLLRFVRLGCTFIPVCIFCPLLVINMDTKKCWYRLLLFGLELSGPIFIKIGQWISTRRDLFPEELCNELSKLQRATKPHSWFYTKKSLERAFGDQWRDIFVKLGNAGKPVGSGCCAQVYKVWVRPEALKTRCKVDETSFASIKLSFVEGIERLGLGMLFQSWDRDFVRMTSPDSHSEPAIESSLGYIPVAIKVLHPEMDTILRRDLRIMSIVANLATWLCPSLQWLSLVECVEDFSKLMKAQVNLCVEATNLERFTTNFKDDPSVEFPKPLWSLSTPYLLTETFEEGVPIQQYVLAAKQPSEFNSKLAAVGINTILKMVFEDNLAHGDLHPGNMLVQQVDDIKEASRKVQPQRWLPLWPTSPPPATQLRLILLDCGIVASLDDRGKKCLKQVFAAVANNDGARVAELFLEHSNHQCKNPESFKRKMKEIVNSALNTTVTLEKVEVAALLTSLFNTVIEHKVKLDGSFSSIIVAIMVLEGLGRALDPTIDIVEKATPYLISSV